MKIVQFTIPVTEEESIVVQEEINQNFYEHLHRHSEIQITLIVKGSGTLIASSNMVEFSENDIFILGSNQEHVFKSNQPENSFENVHSISIYFNPQSHLKGLFVLPEMKKAQKFLASTGGGHKIPSNIEWTIARQIFDVKNSSGTKRISSFMNLIDELSNIRKLDYLSNSALQNKLSENDGLRMNDVYQYTLNNYANEISIPIIAGIAHMTPEAFCRYFKKHTRKTYHNFLIEIRIHEACRMLVQNNSLSSAEIAYRSGFVSSVNFNRVFKKIKSMTPLEYQKKYMVEN
jgi:AraC-like DNA-binding protein/mannose-6-phosphate isomerase-like protein (cupin superfamily)